MTCVILVVLFVFGFAYNWLTAWLEKQGYHEGYVAILVVGGVGVTLTGFSFIRGLEESLWCLACFAVSGFWMVIGSWQRHVQEAKRIKWDILEFGGRPSGDTAQSGRGGLAQIHRGDGRNSIGRVGHC